MAAIAQIGTSLQIGFGTNVLTGYIMEDFSKEATGEQEVIKDEDNATTTILVSDLGFRISFTALIKTTGGQIVPPDQGDSITINSVLYRVESASVKQSRKAAMLTVTAIKEASMTYS